MTVQAGFDVVSILTQDTKLVAYVNVKNRYDVEKKEENTNLYVLRAAEQTTVGVYICKKWIIQKYN